MSHNSSRKSHHKKSCRKKTQSNSSLDFPQLQEINKRECSRCIKNLKVCNLRVKREASFRGDVEIEGQLTVNGTINATGGIVGPIATCDLLVNQIFVNPTCPSCPSDPPSPTLFINAEVAAVPFNIFGENHYSVFKASQCSGESIDITLVIAPEGTGALTTSKPDGTVTGGNTRGAFAIDLQRDRTSAAQVASGENSVIGGGESNTAMGTDSTVSGGAGNITVEAGTTIGGGLLNIASAEGSVIAGGILNTTSGRLSTISGGAQNTTSDQFSTVAGGNLNTASGPSSAIGGGNTNTAIGNCSTIPGGCNNFASGANSFASGTNAGAINDNSFVYGTGLGPSITSTANQAIFNLFGDSFVAPELSNTFFINGNLVTTGTKLSMINHPIREDKFLKSMSVEALRSDLICRGTVQLVNGRADVDIDASLKMTNMTFANLTKNAEAYLTNKITWDLVKVENHELLSTGKFTIISNNVESNTIVNWLVIAERKSEDEILIEVDKPRIIPEIHINNIEINKDLFDKIKNPEYKQFLIQNRTTEVKIPI